MKRERSERTTVLDLCQQWQSLLDVGKLSEETEYRIRKLIDRTLPIADKMFLKTVKGQEMIRHCAERTRIVRDQLTIPGDGLYRSLTALEECFEQMFKKTYEFRVKAG